MRRAVLIAVSILLTACAKPYVTSDTYILSDTLKLPYETAWKKTLQALNSRGFSIDTGSQEGGVITIGETPVKLNERQADCGNFHGISYLKDYRTSTSVKLIIDLEKVSDKATAIRINSSLKASFSTGIGGDTTYLTCYSSGDFEKRLLAGIKE
ncbi:MAG TPA: hypothetical protein VL949_08725 [Geobacteraceae bacterium]|nr:hypothetical protein [Geobacteraceae bacterium]